MKHIEQLIDKDVLSIHTNKGFVDINFPQILENNGIDKIIDRVNTFYREIVPPPNIKEIKAELEQIINRLRKVNNE